VNSSSSQRRLAPVGWAVALALILSTATAAQTPDLASLVADLRQGGYVIVIRHGATNRDQADTDPLNLDNVAKQRQLSPQGIETAKQVGAAFKKLGIPIDWVYTSRFNRAVETGRLIAGGPVTATLDLAEGGLVVTPIENDRRAAALKKMAATPPEPGRNTIIVTHKPNIVDAFGKDWLDVKEGEATVFKPDGAGHAAAVARVQPADWIKAAAAH